MDPRSKIAEISCLDPLHGPHTNVTIFAKASYFNIGPAGSKMDPRNLFLQSWILDPGEANSKILKKLNIWILAFTGTQPVKNKQASTASPSETLNPAKPLLWSLEDLNPQPPPPTMMAFKSRGRKPHGRAGGTEERIPLWNAGFYGSAILGLACHDP